MGKGITPIIATVLLLMMTVAAAGAAYVWMNSLQDQIQKEVENTAGSLADSSRLEFQFRYRKCNSTDSTAEVYLENTGQAKINQGPVSLTLVDTDGLDLEFVEDENAMVKDFNVDTFLQLKFNLTTDMGNGEEYILKVSLPGGVVGSQLCVARD